MKAFLLPFLCCYIVFCACNGGSEKKSTSPVVDSNCIKLLDSLQQKVMLQNDTIREYERQMGATKADSYWDDNFDPDDADSSTNHNSSNAN